jgi:hypothetical protein
MICILNSYMLIIRENPINEFTICFFGTTYYILLKYFIKKLSRWS